MDMFNIEYKQAFDALSKSLAMITFDTDGFIKDANENFLKTMGYEKSEIVGQHHSMFVTPTYAASKEYAQFWEDLRKGVFSTGVYKRRDKQKNEVWLRASYSPVLDSHGKVYKVIKLATDITKDRLKAAYSEGQIEAIQRSQAVIEFDTHGQIITANENFLKTMGYSLDEIKGQNHQMFVTEEYAKSQEYADFWIKLREGKFVADVFPRIGKGGKKVWIRASYNPIFDQDGKLYRVVKYATDITADRMRSADFEGQINAIGKSQAVIEFDLNGNILKANENFLKTMGYSADEVMGHKHSMFVEEDYKNSPEYKAFWDGLRAGKFSVGEFKRIGKGGKSVYIQASYNPIFDLDGNPFKVVKYATDITAQVNRRRDAADKSRETTDNIQTVAGGAEQMLASVKEIAESMGRSQHVLTDIVGKNRQVDNFVQQLQENTKAMEGIASLILDISEQVNLLALNATIEAARAGDAGKGFAVVAGEVKSLANQTAQATDKISSEILTMQGVVDQVVDSTRGVDAGTSSFSEFLETIAAAIDEQEAVTNEISQKMQMIAGGVQSLNAIIQQD